MLLDYFLSLHACVVQTVGKFIGANEKNENWPESILTSIVVNWVLIADPYVRMNEFWNAHS